MLGQDINGGGYFRQLFAWEHHAYAAHLIRLSVQDRRRRFLGMPSEGFLRRHARQALTSARSVVIGWFVDGALRGATEIAFGRRPEDAPAEAAFSVEELYRRNRVGSRLMQRALRIARLRGARDIIVMTEMNNIPMVRLAQRFTGAIHCDGGIVEARIGVPAATGSSVLAALGDQMRDFGMAALSGWIGRLPKPSG